MPVVNKKEIHHYRCGHCQYPLATSTSLLAVHLDCPECGAQSTFHFSPLPASCSLPPGHQCQHPDHMMNSELLRSLEKFCLAAEGKQR
jgi:hypothetical protein